MMARSPARAGVHPLPTRVRNLVRIAGAIAGSGEETVRAVMSEALPDVEAEAVEEIILQSYLFAGFPRALNAARIWRSVSGVPAPARDSEPQDLDTWQRRGERTCEVVYGESYERLRQNIRGLHPALDDWMIVDGYGKVLSRPAVDLKTRELCVVAACAAAGQQRQLHSHFHGAINAGATPEEVRGSLDALGGLVPDQELTRYHQLLVKVSGE